jgi:hypothetical protein
MKRASFNFRSGSALLLASAVSFFLGVTNATADQFGTSVATDWQNWAAFSQGGGVSDTTTVTDQSGGTYVKGNVGVWGPGNISLSGNAILDGDLYYRTTGTLSIKNNARITGTRHHDAAGDTILQNSSNDAYMESSQLATQTDHGGYTYSVNGGPPQSGPLTNINTNQNITITGSGHVVLTLQNFVLISSATITLQGTAATTFVFNVSKSFSLTSSSRIVLSGGILASNVVYNVIGTGSEASVSGSAKLQGILLANQRNVALSGSSITTGEVIGNKVTISGTAQLIHTSP